MPAWHPAPAVRALIAEANTIAPHRSTAGDGTIGDAAHGQRASDHNPEPDGTVDACDLTHDPAGGWNCHARFAELQRRRDRRIAYVIFDGWWFRSYKRNGVPAWTLMPYGGDNKHRRHMHVSVLDEHQDDTRPWFPADAPTQGDDMYEDDDRRRDEVVYAHVTGDRGRRPPAHDPALLNSELGAANGKLDAILSTLGNVLERLDALESK